MGDEKKRPVMTKFIQGKTNFVSRGTSVIKMTKDGKSEYYELPIRSIGIVELMDELKRKAPTPPSKTIKVTKNHDLVKEYGFDPGDVVIAFDVTDEAFQKEWEEYHNDYTWKLLLCALDVEWEDENGNPITDDNKKIEVLKNSGITGLQQTQILNDVARLTSDMTGSVENLLRRPLG